MQMGQELAQSCVRGVPAQQVMKKIARKYRIGLHKRFLEL